MAAGRVVSVLRVVGSLAAFCWISACSGARGKGPVISEAVDGGCRIAAGSTAPLVVEWNGAMRGQLETLRAKHVIAVRHSGCELEMLPACKVKSEYAYLPLTPKRDRVTVRDEEELYANLPLNAVSLSAKLRSAGQLNVDMTMVGRFEAKAATVTSDLLEGDCAGATHVISGLTAGAFTFYAGEFGESGGGVSIAGAGAGQQAKSSVDVLNRDGDPGACGATKPSDASPPFGCGAMIRIELERIDEPKFAGPACANPLVWDGKQCLSSKHDAPGESRPPGPPACPRGTHHEGAGCAPNAMASGAMLRIPGGTFRWAGGEPVLRVATFDLDVTEVTLAQFKACVDAGKCVPPKSNDARCNWGKDGRARHPMNCVSWPEANSYCAWAGKRLPTEIEWEYATVGQTGWKYPWGNAEPDATRSCEVSENSLVTCPVGSFPAGQSRFAILDMSGNVAEWMLDTYCRGIDCPGCGCEGRYRAVRNGNPAAARGSYVSDESTPSIGFRCARSVAGSSPRACPAGTTYSLDHCVPENGHTCPPGMHRNGLGCVHDGSP